MRDAITAAVAAAARAGGVVALVGASGAGKSTLLAQAIAALREGGSPVVPHFTSTADRSEEVRSLAARLVVGVRREEVATAVAPAPPEESPAPADEEGVDVPGDPVKACALAVTVLRGASLPLLAPPLVLAVDAVNQLHAPDAAARLAWLPSPGELPPGLVVLVSTTPGAEADALRGRADTTVVEAGPLDDAEARSLVVDVLWARYAKRLAPANLDALLAKAPGASSPLWQHLALSRLHLLGRGGTAAQGGTLPALIAGLPPTVVGEGGLLSVVLDAAEARAGVSLVRALLLAATVSPSGLRASEALVAVPFVAAALDSVEASTVAAPAGSGGGAPVSPSPLSPVSSPEPLPPRTWALVRAAVVECLRPIAAGAEEVTAPAHALVADAVLSRYGVTAVACARRALAGWYESGASAALPERRATEAPALYASLGDAPALARSLCCAAVVRLANADDSSAYRFLALARAADSSGRGGYDDAAAALFAWADAELDAAVEAERIVLDGVATLFDGHRMFQLPRALALRERLLSAKIEARGEEHADIAESLITMANVHSYNGYGVKALELYTRALAIARKVLGEEHAQVGRALHNMAIVQGCLGDIGKSLELYDRAHAIRRKALGEEHPHVASSLAGMADAHRKLGDTGKALELYGCALSILRKALGEEHADVADMLHGMARVHDFLGDSAKSLELYDHALAIQRKAYGEEHAAVSDTLNRMAVVHSELGNTGKALELLGRALAIRRKAYGEEHAGVAETLHNAGIVHFMLGDTATALEDFNRALAIRVKARGENHANVAVTLDNMAQVYEALGDAGKATELRDRAQVIRSKASNKKT